ncbi:MAG: hypothetical protein KME09_07250 [Pleurocapsa minor HA4230-MV1]|jgi:hypothetical protein|nr:hypothetical protein [Pleurocapsa minor HA4230-MV1]
MSKILDETKKGWIHGGIEWRKLMLEHNIHPDEFLKLPGAEDLIRQFLSLNTQGRVIFLNTLERKYPWLRYK